MEAIPPLSSSSASSSVSTYPQESLATPGVWSSAHQGTALVFGDYTGRWRVTVGQYCWC